MILTKEQHEAIELLYVRIEQNCEKLTDVEDLIIYVLQNDEV